MQPKLPRKHIHHNVHRVFRVLEVWESIENIYQIDEPESDLMERTTLRM